MSADSPSVRRLADWDASRLRDLAETDGTPLYVADLDRVRENVARLQSAFDEEDVSYAVKANSARPVLATVADAGLGAECASPGEVGRALDAGFDPTDVRYTAVNPPDRDLDRIVEWVDAGADVVVTIGAADTLDRLAEREFAGRLCVRVNPGVGAGHHEKVTTGDAPKFGVPYERAADVVADAVDRGFDVVGLHAHAGSGIHATDDLDAHRELVERMGSLARTVIGDPDVSLSFVNVGGGLGVPYRPDEEPLDLDAVASATRSAFRSAGTADGDGSDGDLGDDGVLADVTLGIEPGRYVVADAGVLLTTVNTVKQTPETTVVGVDAGMTALMRPALYDSYHELRNLAPDAADRGTIGTTVAGPICETADVLARDRPLPEPEREDVLAVGNAGAYGYEMASQYNSRPRPARVVLENGTASLATRREGLADLTRLEEPW